MVLSLGIIGTNWITHSFVLAAHTTTQFSLRAVYSRKQETATAFAAEYPSNDITTHTSIASLLSSSPALDAIYIASPNILHFAHAKECLEAGKHVILEKPSVSNSGDLDALFALAKAKGVYLIEAWRHIQEPNFKVLKKAIEEKLDGDVHGASLNYMQFSSRYDKLQKEGIVTSPFDLTMGGGALADLGVYTVAAAVWLFGAPVNSFYFPMKVSTGADGGGHLILQYAGREKKDGSKGSGFTVHLASAKLYDSSAASEIYGEKGTLSVPTVTDIQRVEFWDPRAKKREVLAGEGTGVEAKLNLKEEADEFARIINEKDDKAAAELEWHSREVLKVTEKVRRDNGLLFPGEEK